MKFLIILFTSLILNFSCGASTLGTEDSKSPSHEDFDALLKKYVSATGVVNYKGLMNDKAKLNQYCELLSNNAPDRNTWSKNEQLAYWINAYNAFTLKLIVDNYPVKSIQDLHPKVKIPLINTVWHIKFFKIGGQDANLDEIEHKILRKEFEEPRIHFAINCASISCPPLLNEAFVSTKIDSQLDRVAKSFINDTRRNKISSNQIEISKIFSWFKGDFTKNGNIIDYLNKYSKVKINPKAKDSYLDYDWSLNEK
ncbi:Protein of unknown function, DUF547 [Belliella baltica DSM 15883]|uniref:DUF547 domain-containing protein n=1 Tax=Belliella baltica (strain DSM 15883 / CIP 108006 / LMG 21964 / BA134) TaxID=866536 RepID=I3Z5U9_BELBD|nr:DUF547 domain-containing protein [Belliella baltica]AFL84617.1 Protein of unknown function, DUF547 [Belliella baltica DSM 15883]